MVFLDILQIPIEFIKENLTGWVLLILVVFIIYFTCLRKYYVQREKFYDAGVQLKNLEEVESAEDDISNVYYDNDTNDTQNNASKNDKKKDKRRNTRDSINENKAERRIFKNSNRIDEQFNQDNSNATSRNTNTNTNTNTKKGKQVLEGFQNDIATNTSIPDITTSSSMTLIATTLFDNLNLNQAQIDLCKTNYNQVLAELIIDLGKLTDMARKNAYLNTKKQFDSLLAKSIDNIMNYLTLTIKSPRILTRTAIRTDVISALHNILENLVNKTNQELTAGMNKLAMLNSTTIDYNSQLADINESRAALEKNIAIDKLLIELGNNVNVSQREISSILDKSYILPIYERNFDKISQLVKSDFNDNGGNLADKYSKAYMDFLEQQKKEELDINPLSLASKIESGIVNMLSSISDSNSNSNSNSGNKVAEIKTAANITGEYGDNWYQTNGELREQLTRDYGYANSSLGDIKQVRNNPISRQESAGGLLDNTQLNRENIFRDPSNRGSYLINSKAQRDILEGFEDSIPSTTAPTTTAPTTTSPNLMKAFDDSNLANGNKKEKKQDNSTDITSKLLSGDFLQYMLDTINGYMNGGYDTYKGKINAYLGGITGDGFKIEDNMIPAGFALFILSMLLYFVDLTSS
jgi:hypothetical protein